MELKLFYILYKSSFVGDDIEIGKSDCIEIKKKKDREEKGISEGRGEGGFYRKTVEAVFE